MPWHRAAVRSHPGFPVTGYTRPYSNALFQIPAVPVRSDLPDTDSIPPTRWHAPAHLPPCPAAVPAETGTRSDTSASYPLPSKSHTDYRTHRSAPSPPSASVPVPLRKNPLCIGSFSETYGTVFQKIPHTHSDAGHPVHT